MAGLWPELIKLAVFQHILFIHLLDIFYLLSLCLGQMHLTLVWGRLYFDLRRQLVNIRPFRVIRWFENYAPCVKQRSWRWADRWLQVACDTKMVSSCIHSSSGKCTATECVCLLVIQNTVRSVFRLPICTSVRKTMLTPELLVLSQLNSFQTLMPECTRSVIIMSLWWCESPKDDQGCRQL